MNQISGSSKIYLCSLDQSVRPIIQNLLENTSALVESILDLCNIIEDISNTDVQWPSRWQSLSDKTKCIVKFYQWCMHGSVQPDCCFSISEEKRFFIDFPNHFECLKLYAQRAFSKAIKSPLMSTCNYVPTMSNSAA